MSEYFIFTGLPVFLALFALQSRFFHNWRFLLVSVLAIYFGLWTYPLLSDLVKSFYPKELAPYATMITTAGGMFFSGVIFFRIAAALSSHSGGGYHLPPSRSFLTLLPAALIGLLYSGVIGYLISISPLHCKLAKTESFARKAVRRMQVFTVIMDRFSLQGFSSGQRKKALESRLYPLIDPIETAKKKAEKIRAEKEAAIKKAAAEKAAAEKAAAEKARLEALKKKHRSGKIRKKFIPGEFNGSVRDSHPRRQPTNTRKQITKHNADSSAKNLNVPRAQSATDTAASTRK